MRFTQINHVHVLTDIATILSIHVHVYGLGVYMCMSGVHGVTCVSCSDPWPCTSTFTAYPQAPLSSVGWP